MKKWFRLFAALCLAAVLCVPLAACEWGSESGGSENGGNSGDPSAVRTTVTEEEWNAAVYGGTFFGGETAMFAYLFSNDPNLNMTFVYSYSLMSDSGKSIETTKEEQIDGNKSHVMVEISSGVLPDESDEEGYYNEFYIRPDDETVVIRNYFKDENGQWTMEEMELPLEMTDIKDVLKDVLLDQMYAYGRFTYNEVLQQYEAKDLEIDLSEESGTSLIIDSMTLQFENGKLIREEAQYETELGDVSYSVVSSMTYSYGTASVTLPVVGE